MTHSLAQMKSLKKKKQKSMIQWQSVTLLQLLLVITKIKCNYFCFKKLTFLKSAPYNTGPNVVTPIVYYGVDCHADDVAGLPAKVADTTFKLNKWFKPIGIYFEASYVTLPCKGKSGTHDMTLPSDSQIKSFLLNEVRPLNPRKFVILVSRKGADAGYAGFHYLNAKYGYFHYNSMTSNILAAHELGHGFGLQQFVKNLNLLIIFIF